MSRTARFLVLSATFAVASAAHAQIVIVPASPKFNEAVHVTTPTGTVGNWMPNSVTIAMSGNTITLTVPTTSFESSPIMSTMDVVVGRLPAGSYDVKVVTTGDFANQSLGTGHFVVADRDTSINAPIYDYTDMWWTPAESGWGLSVTQHISTNLFAAWFVYGSDGRATWYVLPSGTWADLVPGSLGTYSGQVYKTTGPYYGSPFLPANVVVTPVGNAQLKFSDYSHGTFTYTIDGVSGSKAIERQPF